MLAHNLARAEGPSDTLARIFALATETDIAAVWSGGRPVHPTASELGAGPT